MIQQVVANLSSTALVAGPSIVPNVEPILTAAHRTHFQKNGYMVVPTGIEPEKLAAVIDVIWDFLGMDPNNPDDWYRAPLKPGGGVELYQHQALWDLRQHPRLYQVFREYHGTGRLGVTTDRVSLKPPRHPDHLDYANPGFIHWDLDLANPPDPTETWVQGVLALTDTAADQGGFQCVPSVYSQFYDFIQTLTEQERAKNRPEVVARGLKVEPIACNAGDVILWDPRLLHGNGLNRSKRPRMAQYITMNPDRERLEGAGYRDRVIAAWRNREAPGPPSFPGDPRRVEQERYRTAELTPLGRCLLELDEWPASVT